MTVVIRNSPLSPLDFFNYVCAIGPVFIARTARGLGFGWVTYLSREHASRCFDELVDNNYDAGMYTVSAPFDREFPWSNGT